LGEGYESNCGYNVLRYVAIDPGETTGIAILDMPARKWNWDQVTTITKEEYAEFYHYLTRLNNDVETRVICERFNFRMEERGRTKIIYTPAEVIGVVKLWCAQNDVPLEEQMAAEGKGFWSDPKLNKLNLNPSGLRHARDATRHLLHYITFDQKDQYYLYGLRAAVIPEQRANGLGY
jgi:hypothetical protein